MPLLFFPLTRLQILSFILFLFAISRRLSGLVKFGLRFVLHSLSRRSLACVLEQRSLSRLLSRIQPVRFPQHLTSTAINLVSVSVESFFHSDTMHARLRNV